MAQGKLTAGFRNRLRSWALRRQGADALPLTLAARRIYILPTRAGWTFAILILVMFIAGMNYGNGLALLFTFWLTGFALVAMVQTQRNLAGTQLLSASAVPAFAGDKVAVSIVVSTRGAVADLTLSTDGDTTPGTPATDPAADAVYLRIAARRRGPWRAPTLQLTSTAPFGLFRTWTWLTLDIATLVYPRLAGDRAVPESPGDAGGTAAMANNQDELAWLRDFRDGDSPRQVAWKAYARGAPLLVREYRGHATAKHDFDFAALRDLDVEARLSQLTRWCVDTAARGEHWTLRLPAAAPLTGAGAEHLERCLQRLALHATRGGTAA
ncbi:MAG: DUF58 domain-containing protein [Steroidobacteraceae bacterium]